MPETTKMSLVGRRSFWAAISSARGIGEVSPYVVVGHLARFFERYVQAGGLTGHDPFHFLGDDARLERLPVVLEDARVDGDAGLGAQETRKLARVIPFDPDQHLR